MPVTVAVGTAALDEEVTEVEPPPLAVDSSPSDSLAVDSSHLPEQAPNFLTTGFSWVPVPS